MTTPTQKPQPAAHRPPTKHQLALMIWLAVFPDPDHPQPRPR